MLVVSVSDKVVQVQLPASYDQVRDKLNVIDVRPWLHLDRSLNVAYPPVAPRPALNPVVQLLDSKPYDRQPRVIASHLDIPCSYCIVRKDQSTDWVRSFTLTSAHDVQLVKEMFLRRGSRRLICCPAILYGTMISPPRRWHVSKRTSPKMSWKSQPTWLLMATSELRPNLL